MALDMFIKVGPIVGETTDPAHSGELAVLAYTWGVSNSVAAGGGGAGRALAQDLSFTTYYSKASPVLFLACAMGKLFDSAVLSVRTTGAGAFDQIEIRLENVPVSSVSMGGSGGEDKLTENYTLSFGRIIFNYVQAASTPPARTGWDFVTASRIP